MNIDLCSLFFQVAKYAIDNERDVALDFSNEERDGKVLPPISTNNYKGSVLSLKTYIDGLTNVPQEIDVDDAEDDVED